MISNFLLWLQERIRLWTRPVTPSLASGFLSDLTRTYLAIRLSELERMNQPVQGSWEVTALALAESAPGGHADLSTYPDMQQDRCPHAKGLPASGD